MLRWMTGPTKEEAEPDIFSFLFFKVLCSLNTFLGTPKISKIDIIDEK